VVEDERGESDLVRKEWCCERRYGWEGGNNNVLKDEC
jgi:hypothetical protein